MSIGATMGPGKPRIPIGWSEPEIRRHACLASTNQAARDAVLRDALTGPAVFVAREQTAGVGRRGARWHSPAGGLWATLALAIDPQTPHEALGLRIGLACVRAVARADPTLHPRLKWPNDVLIEGRKVAGCMAEILPHAGHVWLLIGVGINANNPPPPPDGAAHPPASLREFTDREIDLDQLLRDLLGELSCELDVPAFSEERRREAEHWIEGMHERTRIGEREGRFRGVDAQGRAVLVLDDGTTENIASGVMRAPPDAPAGTEPGGAAIR